MVTCQILVKRGDAPTAIKAMAFASEKLALFGIVFASLKVASSGHEGWWLEYERMGSRVEGYKTT